MIFRGSAMLESVNIIVVSVQQNKKHKLTMFLSTITFAGWFRDASVAFDWFDIVDGSLYLWPFLFIRKPACKRETVSTTYIRPSRKKNQHQPKCGEYTHSKKGEENVRNKHFIAERRRHALVNEIVLLFCLPDELLASCTQFTLFHASFCTN